MTCPACGGTGAIKSTTLDKMIRAMENNLCDNCHGTGRVEEGEDGKRTQ